MISTGLQKLDKFLDGGIPEGLIVDIFGKNGMSKHKLKAKSVSHKNRSMGKTV